MSRPTGVIIEPPIPWMTRQTTNCSSDCDSPDRIEPAMKMTSAMRKTLRAPKRSATQPLAGMNTASDSM